MTAVCFGGYHAVNVHSHGLNLRRQLVDPLHADVFLALTYRHDDNCSSVASCQVLHRLRQLQPFTRVDIEPMQATKDLARTLEELPHWLEVIGAFNNSRRTCWRSPTWSHASAPADSSPWTCIRLQNTQYNTIFSPVIGLSKLNVLRQHYALSHCLRLVRAHEERRRAPYLRLVHSRLEYIWLAPHPPLERMDARCAWVPDGEDFGGLNDRHAVLSRAQAEVYMSRWDMILDGRVMENNDNLRAHTCCGSMSDERWLLSLVRYYRMPVCRFPELAFLSCCNAQTWKSCFRQTCHVAAALNMTLHAKSAAEFASAAYNAKQLADPNATFLAEGELDLSSNATALQAHRLSIRLKPGTTRSGRRPFGRDDWIPGYSLADED